MQIASLDRACDACKELGEVRPKIDLDLASLLGDADAYCRSGFARLEKSKR
jgi:hypothetical protein